MQNRIRETLPALPWLVWEEGAGILGFAYASKWKGRCAYRYSAEVTVYVEPTCTGRGIGSKLYEELLAALRERNFHAVIGGIALPNPTSISLHERLGFRKIAHFEQVGWKFGRWIDVGYWQLLL
jgi:phosphinothricin acetyltransferase